MLLRGPFEAAGTVAWLETWDDNISDCRGAYSMHMLF